MAYSTITEIRQATGMTNSTLIPDARVTGRIAFADGIINGKIGQAYQLPLSATCELVHFLSIEIASLMLYMDEYGEETQNLDKGWQKKLDMAMGVLDSIRELKTLLFDASGVELDRNTLREPSGYPTDESSLLSSPDSTYPKVRMNEQF